MKKIFILILVLSISLIFFSSCGKNDDSDSKNLDGKNGGKNSKTGKENEKILSKVGEKEITEEDFEKMFSILEKEKGSQFLDTEEQGTTLREALREKLLRDTMLGLCYEQYFIKKGEIMKQEDLDSKYNVFLEKLSKNAEKKAFYDELGINEKIIKDSLSRNYYSLKFREEIDKNLRTNYNLTEEEFKKQRMTVKTRHILLKTEEEANDVLEKIKRGSSFEKMVEEKSIDKASKIKGGELGTLKFEDMPIEFSIKAFELEKNKLFGPIKTVFGYHVIEVLDFETTEDMLADKNVSQEEILETKEVFYQRALDIEVYKLQEKLLKDYNATILRDVNVK